MMFGLIPCLTDPKIAVGSVSMPAPLTKFVMMKSSSEMMKASSQPGDDARAQQRQQDQAGRPARGVA